MKLGKLGQETHLLDECCDELVKCENVVGLLVNPVSLRPRKVKIAIT